MLFKLYTQRHNFSISNPKYFLTEMEAHDQGYLDIEETYGFYDHNRETLTEVKLGQHIDRHTGLSDYNLSALHQLANGFYDGILSWVTVGDTEYYSGITTYFLSVERLKQYCSGESRALIHINNDVIAYYSYGREFTLTPEQFIDAKKIADELIAAEKLNQQKGRDGRRLASFISHMKSELKSLNSLTPNECRALQETLDSQCAAIRATRK